MMRRFLSWLIILLLLASPALAEDEIHFKEELNVKGRRIGISQGSAAEAAIQSELPNAAIEYYTDNLLGYTAVAQGKLDAFVFDRVQMQLSIDNGMEGVHLLPEVMDETVKIAVGVSDVSAIPDLLGKVNRFIAELKADGILDDMYRRWVLEGNNVIPEIPLPDKPEIHLTVGTTGSVPPYSYYEGGGLNGYDIELAYRFAAWLGADVSFKIYDFGGIIPAAQAGKIDVIMSNLQYLPERSEGLPFSDILYEEKMGIMVRGDAPGRDTVQSSLQAFEGKRIGVQTGTISGETAQKKIPDITLRYYNTQADAMAALRLGKVDAWATEEPTAAFMLIENDDLEIWPQRLDSSSLASVFAKDEAGQALRDEYSAFVDGLRADGTLAEIRDIWFGPDDAKRTVPDYEALPGTRGTLRMAVDASILPFAYVKDGRIVGYDVDIAVRFCEASGYRLKVVPMEFGGILPSVQSGKCDFSGCGITVTEERAQSVLFSSATYDSGTVLVYSKQDSGAVPAGAYTALAQMNGKRIGVQTGTSFDQAVFEQLPDAEVSYFNNKADLISALLAYKIDGFVVDEPVILSQMQQDDHLTYIPEYMESYEFAYVFPKTDAGQALCDQFSEYLRSIRADGTMAEIEAKWFSDDDSRKTLADYRNFPAPNGTLHMATEAMYEPFSFVLNNAVAGYDIDVAVHFCEANGYRLEIADMSFDAVLPSVQSGKSDFGGAGITITAERAESVLFSKPNYTGGTVMAVLKAEDTDTALPADAQQQESFWDGLASSFSKTFLRENRWELFLEGIGTTMLITLLSILFGTALGFLVFMLCRNGNIIANGTTRFSIWLVTGTPMVVLLMILYYIVFGSVAISGIAVAVIGFTLTFGAAVFSLLRMSVGTIDRGQYEAAYALGHSNRHTFFRIILPQAIPHVLPAYQGEIVGLIKATAIVGYIAVQDLTKMGDIVRSRTYEAFFPLIAITVIYFVLEGLFSFAVSRIRISIDPKKRKRERILKGVDLHD